MDRERAALIALATPPELAPAGSRPAVPRRAQPSLLARALAEGVLPAVAARLEAHGAELLLDAATGAELEDMKLVCPLLSKQVERLDARARGLPIALVKGFTYTRWFPDGYLRHTSDIDLAVRDIDAFWHLAAILERMGVGLRSMSLRRARGRWCGAATFFEDHPRTPTHCDVQIGEQPLRWCSGRPFDDEFWQDAARDWMRPRARQALLMLVGELLEREHILVKDLIDAVAVGRACNRDDARWLLDAVSRHALTGELVDLVHALREVGLHAEVFSALPPGRRLVAPRLLGRVWRHDLPATGRIGLTAMALARDLYYAVGERSWAQDCAAALNRRLDAPAWAERGCYVRLVRVGAVAAPAPAWHHRGESVLLATPIGTFLPLLFPSVQAGDLAKAEEAACAA